MRFLSEFHNGALQLLRKASLSLPRSSCRCVPIVGSGSDLNWSFLVRFSFGRTATFIETFQCPWIRVQIPATILTCRILTCKPLPLCVLTLLSLSPSV